MFCSTNRKPWGNMLEYASRARSKRIQKVEGKMIDCAVCIKKEQEKQDYFRLTCRLYLYKKNIIFEIKFLKKQFFTCIDFSEIERLSLNSFVFLSFEKFCSSTNSGYFKWESIKDTYAKAINFIKEIIEEEGENEHGPSDVTVHLMLCEKLEQLLNNNKVHKTDCKVGALAEGFCRWIATWPDEKNTEKCKNCEFVDSASLARSKRIQKLKETL